MTRAVVVEALGGPEVLQLRDHALPQLGPGLIEAEVIMAGVNFMDIGTRTQANLGQPPVVPGVEGVGRVVAVGPGSSFAAGDRVAWYFAPGSYAEHLVLPEDSAVVVPAHIEDGVAAGLLMQGLSAYHFVTKVRPVELGDIALVHSAGGGVGLLLTQLLKAKGATVVAVVSSPAKADRVVTAGADRVVVSGGGEFVGEVRDFAGPGGVSVAYGPRNQADFEGSIELLAPHGVLAYFGPTDVWKCIADLGSLPRSLSLTYPVVHDFVASPTDLRARSAELFEMVGKGQLKIEIGGRYPLADAALAHRDLESRRTIGKLLLCP